MIEHVADEENAVDRWPSAVLVDLEPPLLQAGAAVGGAAGAGAARWLPVLVMLALERPGCRVLRARFREVGDGLEELGFRRGPAHAAEQRC